MAREEKTGNRDLTYSTWHRHVEKFADNLTAVQRLACRERWSKQIDHDWTDYCPHCSRPLLLIEEARDIGQGYKCATVISNLAKMAGLPCYLVLWTKCTNEDSAETGQISSFRVTKLQPEFRRERRLSPAQWANEILRIHMEHEKTCQAALAKLRQSKPILTLSGRSALNGSKIK